MHTVGTHWALVPLPFMEGAMGPGHAGCGVGVGTTAPGTNRTLHLRCCPLSPHREESRAPGSSPAALLGFSFLCTLPLGVLSSHSCRPQQWALPGCVCPPPPAGVGCCSCQCPQDCGPHRTRGCWESLFCIPQVGWGSKGSPQPPVSPRLGVLHTQHLLNLAGGGAGSEHGIWAAGVRSPRGAGADGWEPHPRSRHLSSTRLPQAVCCRTDPVTTERF